MVDVLALPLGEVLMLTAGDGFLLDIQESDQYRIDRLLADLGTTINFELFCNTLNNISPLRALPGAVYQVFTGNSYTRFYNG